MAAKRSARIEVRAGSSLRLDDHRSNDGPIIVDGDLRQHDKWVVSLNQSVTSRNGLVLEKTKPRQITFRTVPSALALPSHDSAQYANGNRLYALDTVNIG